MYYWAKPTQASSPVTPSLSVHTSPQFMHITSIESGSGQKRIKMAEPLNVLHSF